MNTAINPKTVKLLSKIIRPIAEEGILSIPEYNEIISQLKHLSEKGSLMPIVMPKLIDQIEASEILGVGLSNFKKLEKEGAFPFKRKMVGTSVRYRNTDIVNYLLT